MLVTRHRYIGLALFVAIGFLPIVCLADGEQPASSDVLPIANEPPNPEMKRPTKWGEPTEVQIRIIVIDVDEVNSADQSFAASVFYEARWKSPYLVHDGPGPINRQLTEVWNPQLTIIGLQNQWKAYPDSVEIRPDGTVVEQQKVWGHFSQPLDLHDFPFDQQTLSIHLLAPRLSERDITVVPLDINGIPSQIARSFSLPDFDVLSWKAEPKPYYLVKADQGRAGFEMRINIARQSGYYVLKVIIPLCLIVIMSWLPRWIDPEQMGTNIGISTSAFLTLVAYLFAITVMLPRVSYVTRMDRFILLSTFIVFIGLLQTVFSMAMIRKNRADLASRVDRWSHWVYPVLLVSILAVSFWI